MYEIVDSTYIIPMFDNQYLVHKQVINSELVRETECKLLYLVMNTFYTENQRWNRIYFYLNFIVYSITMTATIRGSGLSGSPVRF